MKLNGKKIAFLGDSITEGVGTSGCPNRFCDLIEEATGAECLNYGISGTRIAIQTRPSEPSSFDRYFSSRVDDMDTDADIIFVFGGTNDFGHGDAPFGCMEDRTPVTFYGGLHDLFVRLIERYPGKPIVIATPLHRLGETCIYGECKPKEVGTLLDYVQAIRRVAEHYSLPVLDLFAVSGLQPSIDMLREKYMPDGLHPNDAGHRILAQKIIAFLETC